jgi:hypothetical protein
MRFSYAQIRVDEQAMTDYICERLTATPTKLVLAAGEEGETWADLWGEWDNATGWNLSMERSEEDVDLCMVYDHFRHREMSSLDWRRERESEENRSKVHKLERELFSFQAQLVKQESDSNPSLSAAPSLPAALLATMEAGFDRITDLLDQQKTVKEWYSVAEVAQRLRKAEFTVRD